MTSIFMHMSILLSILMYSSITTMTSNGSRSVYISIDEVNLFV